MRVYEKIRNYLQENNLQPLAVAQKANIQSAIFDALISGKKKMYADDHLAAICYALNVHPEAFVDYKIV